MFDRRTLIALAAGLPLAGNAAKLDLPDPRIKALNTEGADLFGISPDASVLVGIRDGNRLAFLDAETGFTISESEANADLAILEKATVSWSPDSSKIAFGFSWMLGPNRPIWIAEVETGQIETIGSVEPGDLATTQPPEDSLVINFSAVWLDDDTLLVARQTSSTNGEPDIGIWAINVANGNSELYTNPGEHGISLVSSRIWKLRDGNLVFAARVRDPDGTSHNGVVIVSPDGDTITELRPGELTTSMLQSVNDTHMITIDVALYETRYIALDPAGDSVLQWDQFTKPDGWEERTLPILGPYPNTMFSVLTNANETLSAHLFVGDKEHQLHQLDGEFRAASFHWAGSRILIAGADDSWLIDVPERLLPTLDEGTH